MRIRSVIPLLLAAIFPLVTACDGGDAASEAGSRSRAGDPAGQSRDPAPDSVAEQEAVGDLTTIRVADIPVRVEIADEESERQRGLMYRDSLPRDQGMLFAYPEQRTLSFWMRNTRIPLSIAFIDRRGVIVDIQQMDPNTEKLHRSSAPAMYALEMSRGWFEERGVREGDRVEF